MPKIDINNANSDAQSLFKIIWTNLCYDVDLHKNSLFLPSKKRRLIENLNGSFVSSSLIGVLGPSGCGKSTLLRCLSRRVKRGVSGEISLIGHKCVRFSFIPQHDPYFHYLTTRETLVFASRLLRNDVTAFDELTNCDTTNPSTSKIQDQNGNKTKSSKRKSSSENFHCGIAELMLEQLHLIHVKHNLCGNLSGGQLKRLSIGQVLIGNPDIVFLDEPTSGLDSFSSLICLNLLRHYSKLTLDEEHELIDSHLFEKKSNLVVTTIHQPNEQLVELFDELLFLAEKGRFIYKDSPANLIPTLHRNGGVCPEHYNPAEYLLEIISGLHGRSLKNNLSNQIQANYLNRNHSQIDNQITRHSKTNLLNEIIVLLHRDFIILIRNKLEMFGRFFYFFGLGLFIGLLFATEASQHSGCPSLKMVIAYLTNNSFVENFEDQNYTEIEMNELRSKYSIGQDWEIHTQQMLTTNLSNFGFSLMVCLIGSVLPFTIFMPEEMAITVIQHRNSFFSTNAYFIAKYLSDLPFTVLYGALFSSITYLLNAQLMQWQRFIMFISIFSIIALIAQVHGMIVGVLFYRNRNMSIFFGTISLIPFLLFCGVFIRIEILPSLFQYLTYFSHLKYSFEGILLAIYSYDRCDPVDPIDLVYLKSLIKNLEKQLFRMLKNVPTSFLNSDDDLLKNTTQAVQKYININGELFNVARYLDNYRHNETEESLLFQVIPIENKSILHKYLILFLHYVVHIFILYYVIKWKLSK